MPTKIVASQSNSSIGEINKQELEKIIADFNDDNLLIQRPTQVPVKKTSGINIPLWIIRKLIQDSFSKDGIEDKYLNIRFAISLPGQTSCVDNSDVSNHLTAVLNIGKKDSSGNMVERTDIDDEIITLGFKPQPNELQAIPKNLGFSSSANLALMAPVIQSLDACCGHPTGT